MEGNDIANGSAKSVAEYTSDAVKSYLQEISFAHMASPIFNIAVWEPVNCVK